MSTRKSTNVVGDVSVPFAIRNMQNNIHVPYQLNINQFMVDFMMDFSRQ